VENNVILTLEQMGERLSQRLGKDWDLIQGVPTRRPQPEITHALRKMIQRSDTLREIKGPFMAKSGVHTSLYAPEPGIERDVKVADRAHWERNYSWRSGITLREWEWEQVVHSNTQSIQVPSLQALCVSKLSHWRMAYGLINGRKPYTNTMDNFRSEKIIGLMSGFDTPTRTSTRTAELTSFFQPAMDRLYYAMGTSHLFRTQDIRPDLERDLRDMYVGSAHGLSPGENKTVTIGTDKLKISSCGKKYEELEAVLRDLRAFFVEGVRPCITWKISPKLEHLFSWTKQLSDAEFFEWQKKCRLFVIPNTHFIVLERMVSKMRHLVESGRVIRIRSKWVYGGADHVAKLLQSFDHPNRKIWEADFKGLDLSVKDILTEMYFGSMLYYYKTTDPMYPIYREILEFLAQEISQRVTYLWEDIWVLMMGKVPSGCFNTSHFDSWGVAFLYYLFVTHQYSKMDQAVQAQVDDFLLDRLIHIIVYGDDNLSVSPEHPVLDTYLNYHAWSAWLKYYWDMTLRDIKNVPFLSTAQGGWLRQVGACWLRHYFIRNPNRSPKQARYVPFRETREHVIRAVHGKEPAARTRQDVLLSVMGHAYGTFGVNYDAYYFLRELYGRICGSLRLVEADVASIVRMNTNIDTIRKWRRLQIDPETLMKGFPAIEVLQARNESRPEIHEYTAVHEWSNMLGDFLGD